MTKALVLEAYRCELPKSRKVGQGRQRSVVHILAADTKAAQRGHSGECDKPATAKVWAFTAPKELERLRSAQLHEAVVGSNGFLRSQPAQARHCRDVPHRHIVAQFTVATQ